MQQHHIQRDLHKKRIFQKRQIFPGFPVGDDEEPPTRGPAVPPTTTSSTTPIVRGPTSTPGPIPTPLTTTSTSATTSSSTINPLSILIPGLTTSSSTTSSRASTTSTSTSSSTSTTTSSSSSSSTTPLTTQSRNVATTTEGTITRFTTATPSGSKTVSSAAASSTATPESTSNTGAIVGGIFGAIVGIAVLACIIAFVIRKLRQRRLDEEHFDAAKFRNSAMVIEDDNYSTHNDAVTAAGSQPYNTGGRGFGARPPTMIERHMANTPALPVAAYGAYGASAQVNQYPDYGYEPQQQYHGMPTHDMNNLGNPFAPSDPMMDQRGGHDMYGQQPVHGYENPAQYHAQQQQYVDMERVTSPGRVHSPPHPTEFSTVPEAAAHPTASTPGQNIPPQSQVQGSPVQTPPAQTTPQSQQQREPAPAVGAKRPETIYDEDDAYGGM